jgi:hypothetical protein
MKLRIYKVCVKHKALGCRFVCMPTALGFKCGRCGHGNLGPDPKLRQQCRVCKSRVSEVLRIRPDDRFLPGRMVWPEHFNV